MEAEVERCTSPLRKYSGAERGFECNPIRHTRASICSHHIGILAYWRVIHSRRTHSHRTHSPLSYASVIGSSNEYRRITFRLPLAWAANRSPASIILAPKSLSISGNIYHLPINDVAAAYLPNRADECSRLISDRPSSSIYIILALNKNIGKLFSGVT